MHELIQFARSCSHTHTRTCDCVSLCLPVGWLTKLYVPFHLPFKTFPERRLFAIGTLKISPVHVAAQKQHDGRRGPNTALSLNPRRLSQLLLYFYEPIKIQEPKESLNQNKIKELISLVNYGDFTPLALEYSKFTGIFDFEKSSGTGNYWKFQIVLVTTKNFSTQVNWQLTGISNLSH